jgi:hypothetical protein
MIQLDEPLLSLNALQLIGKSLRLLMGTDLRVVKQNILKVGNNMIKSMIQLIPYGFDESARVISGFYIANVGYSEGYNYEGNFDYVVGYFEKASKFTNNKPVAKIMFVSNWNNKQGTFELLHTIFGDYDSWWNISDLFVDTGMAGMTEAEIQAIEIFKQRAKEDGVFEEDNIS